MSENLQPKKIFVVDIFLTPISSLEITGQKNDQFSKEISQFSFLGANIHCKIIIIINRTKPNQTKKKPETNKKIKPKNAIIIIIIM